MASLVLVGCGGSSDIVKPRGKLLVAGSPYDQKTSDPLMVIFYPVGTAVEDTYPAIINDDGTFEVIGRDGDGIPPGKYAVSIEPQRDNLKTAVAVLPTYKGRQSSLVVEITADHAEVPPIEVTQ